MSADNWAVCPACNPDKELDECPHTLREDYAQGMEPDGTYSIIYRCSCDCGFRWSYQHSVKVDTTRKAKP